MKWIAEIHGSNDADKMREHSEKIVKVPVHTLRSQFRVAEAAKVLENLRRDVNRALVNELAILFEKIGFRHNRCIRRFAGSKWNVQRYTPGLVGGDIAPGCRPTFI